MVMRCQTIMNRQPITRGLNASGGVASQEVLREFENLSPVRAFSFPRLRQAAARQTV